MNFMKLVIISIGLLVFGACGPDVPPSGGYEAKTVDGDDWLVFGAVSTQGFAGGEVVAIGMDGSRYRSTIADDQSFGIELPANSTFAVYFVTPKAQGNQPGVAASEFVNAAIGPRMAKTQVALLTFEESAEIGLRNTLRLPKVMGKNELDLGEIDIKNQAAYPTINPATVLDFDNDGLNDFSDTDDQNDGLLDKMQKDMIERVQICHTGSKNGGVSENVPLSGLFEHMEHGDTMGPCKNGNKPAPTPSSADNKDDSNAPNNLPAAGSPEGTNPRKSGAVIERTPDEEGEEKDEDDKKSPEKGGSDKAGEDKDKDDNADDKNKEGDDDKKDGEAGGNDDKDEPAPNKPKKPKKPEGNDKANGLLW